MANQRVSRSDDVYSHTCQRKRSTSISGYHSFANSLPMCLTSSDSVGLCRSTCVAGCSSIGVGLCISQLPPCPNGSAYGPRQPNHDQAPGDGSSRTDLRHAGRKQGQSSPRRTELTLTKLDGRGGAHVYASDSHGAYATRGCHLNLNRSTCGILEILASSLPRFKLDDIPFHTNDGALWQV